MWETVTGQKRCRRCGHNESTASIAFAPDGRTLASTGWDETIRLWDLNSCVELAKLTGHRGKVNSLAFTPDSRTLISGGDDTTIMFWDVATWSTRPRRKVEFLKTDVDRNWQDLSDTDAAKAFRAISSLDAASDSSVRFIRDRLKLIESAHPNKVRELLHQLDSPRFSERQKAMQELEILADQVSIELRTALGTAKSAEVRSVIQKLLDRLDEPTPDMLRTIRAVEVLEHIATPAARDLLADLAKGAPGARLTVEAMASLARLKAK